MSKSDTSNLAPADLAAAEGQISRLSIKVPPFWKHNPALWFVQVEAQFSLGHVSQDVTKFNHVIAAIETDVLAQISDLVLNPPESDRYNALKTRLIQQFADSEEKRIRQLLIGLDLGDKRPSQLLREMHELAAEAVNDDFLKSLWLQRLPIHVQQILAASRESLPQLVLLADKICEVTDTSVSTLSQHDVISRLEAKVDKLSTDLARLHTQIRSRSSSRHRSKQNVPRYFKKYQPALKGVCFYHSKFGAQARKCKEPCSFNSENQAGRHSKD